MIKDFGKTAIGLARNPLGIIALFIVLVYGFAAFVLGFSGDNISHGQKWLMVIFLVSFPVLVFLGFIWLVVRYPQNLYSPGDFSDEKEFGRLLTLSEQKSRIQEEVIEFEKVETASQKDQTTIEMEGSGITARKNFVTNFMLAEELAIRSLEVEYQTPARRQVKVVSGYIYDAWIDPPIPEVSLGIEVKYLPDPKLLNEASNRLLAKITSGYTGYDFSRTANEVKMSKWRLRLILAFVIGGISPEATENEQNRVRQSIEELGLVNVDVRIYSLESLQKMFGIDQN